MAILLNLVKHFCFELFKCCQPHLTDDLVVRGTQEERCFVIDISDGNGDTRSHCNSDVNADLAMQRVDNRSNSTCPTLKIHVILDQVKSSDCGIDNLLKTTIAEI